MTGWLSEPLHLQHERLVANGGKTRFLRSQLRKVAFSASSVDACSFIQGRHAFNHLGCALAQVQCSRPQVLKERLGDDPRIGEHAVFRSFQMGEGDENVQNRGFRSLRGFHSCDGCLGRSIKIPLEQIARSQSPRISISSFAFLFSNQHIFCLSFCFFSMFFHNIRNGKVGKFPVKVLRLVGFDTMLWSQARLSDDCPTFVCSTMRQLCLFQACWQNSRFEVWNSLNNFVATAKWKITRPKSYESGMTGILWGRFRFFDEVRLESKWTSLGSSARSVPSTPSQHWRGLHITWCESICHSRVSIDMNISKSNSILEPFASTSLLPRFWTFTARYLCFRCAAGLDASLGHRWWPIVPTHRSHEAINSSFACCLMSGAHLKAAWFLNHRENEWRDYQMPRLILILATF